MDPKKVQIENSSQEFQKRALRDLDPGLNGPKSSISLTHSLPLNAAPMSPHFSTTTAH